MNIVRAAHIHVYIVEEWLEYKEHSAAEEDDHHQRGTGVLPHHVPEVDLPLRHFSALVHSDVVEIPEGVEAIACSWPHHRVHRSMNVVE